MKKRSHILKNTVLKAQGASQAGQIQVTLQTFTHTDSPVGEEVPDKVCRRPKAALPNHAELGRIPVGRRLDLYDQRPPGGQVQQRGDLSEVSSEFRGILGSMICHTRYKPLIRK